MLRTSEALSGQGSLRLPADRIDCRCIVDRNARDEEYQQALKGSRSWVEAPRSVPMGLASPSAGRFHFS